MAVAYCIDCGQRLYLGERAWVGQAVFCNRCGADLEVTQVNPPVLEWTDDLVDENWPLDRGTEEPELESVSA
jgi:alpha-aminoadipate carrier protein LysW